MNTPDQSPAPQSMARLRTDFERALDKLAAARPFAKGMHQSQVFGLALKLLKTPEGIDVLYEFAPRFDDAGLFAGGDWAHPDVLRPALVRGSLLGQGMQPALECLSQLRFLAIAEGAATHPSLDATQARAFLEQVLASNLDLLFPTATEASRERQGRMADRIQRLFEFILARLGGSGILAALMFEVDRVLLQRPIMIQRVEALLNAARRALEDITGDGDTVRGARRLIAALHGPTPLAREHPAAGDYRAALSALDPGALAEEARAFGEAMAGTGLVAPQHATLLNFLAAEAPDALAAALALDRVGQVSLEEHAELVAEIIQFTIRPETVRCVYGLSRMLGRGTLFFPPVAPGLRRLMLLPVAPTIAEQLRAASEYADPPPANVLLMAGTLSVLGQPRGVDQGHNPTCQAARAISLWSQNDVGYLLELIARAARDDELVMHFEGDAIRSGELSVGLAATLHTELDPVSLVLTPHLDRIYMEMSRRTIGRGADGHKWVNPEFHGWWVYRGFAELVDTGTGRVTGCDDFIRTFYAAYHPRYNGGRSLVYMQPCGIAVTDHNGAFVGWHAIAIQRVALDPEGICRVYFFNPNRDKGQNWGQGVVTSTHDHGEFEGESSLPFEQFASRLYVFHYKLRELGDPAEVPAETVAGVRDAIAASWAAGLEWQTS